ncbi:MAG: biopolymer transporter ExbD [Thermosynechococcaceae cyanobacterium MS004]|nr:biopolymer transporter ExbD [Thermosynechococcaceae cyanobacterium MS004]
MKFRAQQRSPMPDLNLIPLMDVIMVILTFFILVSMTLTNTLTNTRSLDIRLPQGAGSEPGENAAPLAPGDRLVVGLNNQGQVLLNGVAIAPSLSDTAQLDAAVSAYLVQNPAGVVMLQVDQQVPYQQVAQLLEKLRSLGGDRVSLALE